MELIGASQKTQSVRQRKWLNYMVSIYILFILFFSIPFFDFITSIELPSEKLEEELQVYVEDYEEEPQTEPTTTSAHAPRSGKSPKNNW